MGSNILIYQILLLKMCLWQCCEESPHKECWAETAARGSYSLVMLRAGLCSASSAERGPFRLPPASLALRTLPSVCLQWVTALSSWQREQAPWRGCVETIVELEMGPRALVLCLLCETTCSPLNCNLVLFLGVIQTTRGSRFCSFIQGSLAASLVPSLSAVLP